MDAFELSDTSPNVKYLRAFFLAVFILTFASAAISFLVPELNATDAQVGIVEGISPHVAGLLLSIASLAAIFRL